MSRCTTRWICLLLTLLLATGCLPEGSSGNNGNGSNGSNGSNGTTNNGTPGDTPDFPVDNECPNGPLSEPIDGCAPEPLESTGNPRVDCVRRINQLRWECQCLPPLARWEEGEQCADEQAAYDAENNSAHAGFQDNICSPRGSAQNECPGYGSWDRVIGTCLQQMWNEGPGEPFSEHGHYINMTNPDYSKVACGSGDGWYVQNFSP